MSNTTPTKQHSRLVLFLTGEDENSYIFFVYGFALLLAMCAAFMVVPNLIDNAVNERNHDTELGIDPEIVEANLRADARMDQYADLRFVPVPTWSCESPSTAGVEARYQWYFEADADLSAWTTQECSRIYTGKATGPADTYSQLWWNWLDSLYAFTDTPLDRGMTFRAEGFTDAADYADYYYNEQLAGQWPTTTALVVEGATQDETFWRELSAGSASDYSVVFVTNLFLEGTEYDNTPAA